MMSPQALENEIATLAAQLDAAMHRLLTLIRRFDDSGAWGVQGALSCAHWLSWRVGVELGAAREHVRVARALADLPAIDAALQTGRLSYSKVRALTRVASSDNEAVLLELARTSTASQLERICRGYRRAIASPLGDHPEDEAAVRWVQQRDAAPGLVRLLAQLTADEAAVVERAIDHAAARAWKSGVSAGTLEERRNAGARRADALVTMAEQYLQHANETLAGPPVTVVVHTETGTIGGTLDDGTPLPATAVERVQCDATITHARADGATGITTVSRRRRTIPTLLRRALLLRDGGCRFPGCTNRWVDGHHVVPWSAGGATSLENLLALCRRHHRYVHEYGFRIEHDHDTVRFFRGNGAEVTASGESAWLKGTDGVGCLPASTGIPIHAQSNFPAWDGRAPDYDTIIGGLAFQGSPSD